MAKSSLVDYPGKIAGVLFTAGCNYNCFYCHNRSCISKNDAKISMNEVWSFLEKRIRFLDGVVITGGEPTLQSDLLSDMKRIKKMGYAMKLDTNGSSPQVVADVLQNHLCDYVAVDYKAPADRYEEICGKNFHSEPVRETINLLEKSGIDFEVRTTVIPQLTQEDLICMAEELPFLSRYRWNRYRRPEVFLPEDEGLIQKEPYTKEKLLSLADIVRRHQPNLVF